MQKFNDGESDASTAKILVVAGSAALIGGGVLYWLGWRQTSRAQVAIAPLGGTTAMVVTCAF
jgi:hypothetical protein